MSLGSKTRPTTQRGAPHLARFSRDVGFHRSHPETLHTQSTVQGQHSSVPHLAKNERDAPKFLYAALDRTACAALFKESRIKTREPMKLHRKSGMWGTPFRGGASSRLVLHRGSPNSFWVRPSVPGVQFPIATSAPDDNRALLRAQPARFPQPCRAVLRRSTPAQD
jgi:hypothetical protein